MKTAIFFLLPIVLLAAGCQTTGVTPELQKELDARASYAKIKFFECGSDAVSTFDDGVSSAYVVGRAIGQYCSDYASVYADAQYKSETGNFDREYFYKLLVEKTFADFVLVRRAKKLKGQ